MKPYKLSLLIATTDNNLLKNKDLLNIDHPNIEIIVIQQLINSKEELKINHPNYKVYSFLEKGISNSRNRAIEKATGDICLITDDDVKFTPNFYDKIITAYSQLPNADLISFKIRDEDGIPFKEYKKTNFEHSIKTIPKVSSVEISFKRKSIEKINFNSKFGLGARYKTGEELIFLNDCLKSSLKLFFYPEYIAIHELESSGSNFKNEQLIIAKGALFRQVYGFKGILANFYFAIKKYNLYKNDHSFFRFTSLIFKDFFKPTT